MMAMCPMSVPGTEVLAGDVHNGETLTFTTSGAVQELRVRVRAMAGMHNEHHADAATTDAMMGREAMGPGNGMGRPRMPPSWATVLDVERGATIVLVPNASEDLQMLQTATRDRAAHLRMHGCGMMGQTRN
jgi:hypothetical protein